MIATVIEPLARTTEGLRPPPTPAPGLRPSVVQEGELAAVPSLPRGPPPPPPTSTATPS